MTSEEFVNPPATADVPGRRITRVVTARAPLARVWSALSEPDEIKRWLGDIASFPAGFRRGASGRIAWTGEEVLAVQVVEVVPEERVVFQWSQGFMNPAATTVTLTVKPDPLGTLIHLEERGFQFAGFDNDQVLEALRALAQSWTLELDELVEYVEGATGPSRA